MSGITGATIGTFDGVHKGHQYLISRLKELSDKAMVVTFANHPLWVVTGRRQPKILLTPEEKCDALRAEGVIPVILPFDDTMRSMTAEEFVGMLARDYGVSRLLFGFNNSIGSDRCGADADERLQATTGVEIIRANELPGDVIVNSSTIRELISEGDMAQAAMLLGRLYSLQGSVVHGKEIGRKLGFPTANIAVDNADKLIPALGVYAADAIVGNGETYRAVVNIGNRPTIDAEGSATIEAHLDGFTGYIYGEEVELHFIARLRGEKKFASLDELRDAIACDLKQARRLPR